MAIRRRRLAQLELELAARKELNLPTLEPDLIEMQRTMKAADEEKVDDPPLLKRGQARLDQLSEEWRRALAMQAIIKATGKAFAVGRKQEAEEKKRPEIAEARKRFEALDPASPDDSPETAAKKRRDKQSEQRKKDRLDEEKRVETYKEEKGVLQHLDSCVLEAQESGVSEEHVIPGMRAFAELKLIFAVRSVLLLKIREAQHQAKVEVWRQQQAKKAADRAAAKAAIKAQKEKESAERRAKAEAAGEEYLSDEAEESSEEEVEDEPEMAEAVQLGDKDDDEDGSKWCVRRMIDLALERDVRVELRNWAKEHLKSWDLEVYEHALRHERDFTVEAKWVQGFDGWASKALDRVIGEVEGAGIIEPGEVPVDPYITAMEEAAAFKEKALRGEGQSEQLEGIEEAEEAAAEEEEEEEEEEDEDEDEGTDVDQVQLEIQAMRDDAMAYGEAKTRLAALVMWDAMEARDLEALHERVPAATEAGVEESHTKLGWRLIRELELLIAMEYKHDDITKVHKFFRAAVDLAREVEVVAKVLNAGIVKLCGMEMTWAIKFNRSEILRRAIDEGEAAGMRISELRKGKMAYAEMMIGKTADMESADEIRELLELAINMGMSTQREEFVVAKRRMAQLDLRDKIKGSDVEVIKAALDLAKEMQVPEVDQHAGRYRLADIELEDAVQSFDSERLLYAMKDAKAEGYPMPDFVRHKKKLRDISETLHTEWILVELEQALEDAMQSDEAPSMPLSIAIDNAKKYHVDEEDILPSQKRFAWLELGEVTVRARNEGDEVPIYAKVDACVALGWTEDDERMIKGREKIAEIELMINRRKSRDILNLAASGTDPFSLKLAIQDFCAIGADLIYPQALEAANEMLIKMA
eukprot:TRINITY_DN7200_c1_g1_i1.p1 TRINITY_DN7200_c1_g1~~TRINITY_DN7200_c1_g1_i1.p1  ORF type:complete len:986 (-),score=297.77 TRINITY_DN7200_c1_g1_i1:235-2841(-)